MSAATFGDERLPARFWAKVREADGGCWEWIGGRNEQGYGRCRVAGGRTRLAHRLAFAALVGNLPPYAPQGLQLDHLCRVRACVNPAHLELVTPRENILRGEGLAAEQWRRTHCPQGHELAGGNLVPALLAHGRRGCLTCKREQDAALAAAHAALGINRRAYRARFGQSRATAEDIVARVAAGVRPDVILAGADLAIAATEAELEQLDIFGEAS